MMTPVTLDKQRSGSLLQGTSHDGGYYRVRKPSTSRRALLCCGDPSDVHSPTSDPAAVPRIEPVASFASSHAPLADKEQPDMTPDVKADNTATTLLALPEVYKPAAAHGRGRRGSHGETSASRSQKELMTSPETSRTTLRRGSLTASQHTPPKELAVARSASTSRPPQWNSSLGPSRTSVVEHLPRIATQQQDKFARLMAGGSVASRPHHSHPTRRSASSSTHALPPCPAPLPPPQASTPVATDEAATRRAMLRRDIAAALGDVDFAALGDALRADRHYRGPHYTAARSLFRVLTHEHDVLTRDDLHDLLVLFTPPGAARHEAADFLWEACEHRTQLTLDQFIRHGAQLRERLFAYDHFTRIDDAQEQLRAIFARVFATDAVVDASTMRAQLLEAAARQIDGDLADGVHPLRVYEHDFVLDYGATPTAARDDGVTPSSADARRRALQNVSVPAQRAPFVQAASGDTNNNDTAVCGARDGTGHRTRPPRLSEEKLSRAKLDAAADRPRRKKPRLLTAKKSTKGGQAMGGDADCPVWGEKERREQDECFIRKLHHVYKLR